MAISENNIRIKITIPKELNELLKQKSNEQQRSVSNYVYHLIIKDLENK